MCSLHRFRQLAIVTTVGICLLVVAGGVVRLTGSGLGCDDWPNCNSERFVDVSSGHAAIEQINRIFSGFIGIPTLALLIAAFRVRPRVAALRGPAIGVFVTVLANGLVGGLAVRGDLHPALVQSHFLLAMISIAFGVVAVRRSGDSWATSQNAAGVVGRSAMKTRTRALAVGLGGLTALALISGTVVTGTGPHAGDEDVRRYGFDISNVARLHGATVIIAMVVALSLAFALRTDRDGRRMLSATVSGWIFVGLVQGAIGYTQYFNGVPELLVATHIAFATGLWVLTVVLVHRAVAASSEPIPDRISAGGSRYA